MAQKPIPPGFYTPETLPPLSAEAQEILEGVKQRARGRLTSRHQAGLLADSLAAGDAGAVANLTDPTATSDKGVD